MAALTYHLSQPASVVHRHPVDWMAWQTEDDVRHCDNCAADLPILFSYGVVENIEVTLCANDGACLHQLQRRWAPKAPWYAPLTIVISLAASVLLWLGR